MDAGPNRLSPLSALQITETKEEGMVVTYPRRCKTSSVGQSAGLLIPRSSVRFRQKLRKLRTQIYMDLKHRPSSKGTKLLFQVIKAIIHQLQQHDLRKYIRVKTLQDEPESAKEILWSEGPWLGEELEIA